MPSLPITAHGSTDPEPAVPQVHHDAATGRTVFIAPQRARRPVDTEAAGAAATPDRCPFCVGNESRTPAAVLRAPADEGLPWRSRIVPNLYPFTTAAPPLAADPQRSSPRAGQRNAAQPTAPRDAHGVHEVVIESAAHESSVLAVPPAAWREVWELVRCRLGNLAGRDDLAWAMVFKNSGPRAGASLVHLHSQLVALDFVPPVIEAEFTDTAASAACGHLLDEARAAGRVVAESGGLVAVVPPVARQPFETWILPRERSAFLHEAAPADIAALAELTQWFVTRLARLAPDADYNWWLHQPPFRGRAARPGAAGAHWRWHLEILPRLAQFAGFELGTGCHVTTVSPAESARLLRGG